MTEQERFYAFGHWEMKTTPMCATCAHYCQHYAECRPGVFHVVNCGHCMYPRLKMRKPHNLCDHYQPSEDVKHMLYIPKGYGYAVKGERE